MPLEPEDTSASSAARLFAERERVRGATPCAADVVTLTPDTTPAAPAGKCDEPEATPKAVFSPPNLPPAVPADPDLLPDAIIIYSQEATALCAEGQVELSGAAYPFVVDAGAAVQEVFLDDIMLPPPDDLVPAIAQSELFRLATYSVALQAYVTANLIDSINGTGGATLGDFDDGLVALVGVPLLLATKIREALVIAQGVADDIAQATAEASIVCGWRNREMWVVCDTEDPGYAILYAEPGDEFEYVAAGVHQSTVSQVDADNLAAIYAAFDLQCLVGNTEQTATCGTEEILDETTLIDWPTEWPLPNIDPTTSDMQTLAGAIGTAGGENSPDAWQSFEFDLVSIALNDLNGQEFKLRSQVGSNLLRVLRTTAVTPANTPTAAARTQDEANAIAYNLAAARLDCFFPNRPRVISCMTETYGNAAVALRAAAVIPERENDEDGRQAMYEELRGGDPVDFDGPAYERRNKGLQDLGDATESLDVNPAFEVWVWPGLFVGSTEAEADAQAALHGAGFLACSWISPKHQCECSVDEQGDAEQTYGLLSQQGGAVSDVDISGKYQTDPDDAQSILDAPGGSPLAVKLDLTRSVHTNVLSRGLISSLEYPNVANGYEGDFQWPDLATLCQSALSCMFVACKMACCEPRPDDRPNLINEAPNFASTTASYLAGTQSNQTQHELFREQWVLELSTRSIDACALSGGTIVFSPDQFDDCALTLLGDDVIDPSGDMGTAAAIVHPGPNDGHGPGMPARFKYGGLLKWGQQWAEPASDGVQEDPDTLWLPGTVKACHKAAEGDTVAVPDPWGFYHCAEGVAESFDPHGLAEQARNAAVGQLDCTHIAWPRHIVTCAQPNQKPWGGGATLDVITEGATTGDADQTLETMLLTLLECRDTHNFMLTFTDNLLSLPGPAMAVVGKSETECHPLGLSQATLYDPDGITPAEVTDRAIAAGGGHVVVHAACTPDGSFTSGSGGSGAKKLILTVSADPGVTYESIRDANQKGRLGIESGTDFVGTLRQTGVAEVYYIGSYHVTDMGAGKWRSITSQAHSGPIILHDTCCPDGSSSDSGSGDSGSFGSGDSGSSSDSGSGDSGSFGSGDSGSAAGSGGSGGGSGSGSTGGSTGGSGSDKSTAIVPMPWHAKKFGALFTMESNEVLFEFVLRDIPLTGRRTRYELDHRYRFVCEPNSLVVAGQPNPDVPANMSARIEGAYLVIEAEPAACWWKPWHKKLPSKVTLKLTGVRRGFAGMNMPERSVAQFNANENFLNSIYPPE